jgi:hypothetical protein
MSSESKTTWAKNAQNEVAYEFSVFAGHHSDAYFHPMERDYWVAEFCAWLAAKQRRSAEVRASND